MEVTLGCIVNLRPAWVKSKGEREREKRKKRGRRKNREDKRRGDHPGKEDNGWIDRGIEETQSQIEKQEL